MDKANDVLKRADEQLRQDLDHIYDPKKQEKTFGKRVGQYSKPMWKVIIGTLSSLVAGLVAPLFGFLIMKILSEMMFAQYAGENVLAATGDWTLMMVAAAILIMIAKASSVINFSGIGQNIIKNVRKELYSSILHKEIGWHDDSTNGSGVLTATLASDVSTLNGVSSEGRAA